MARITDKLTQIEYLELSIQICLNGLSFCILNKSENEIITLKNITFSKTLTHSELLEQLKNLFNTESILQNKFNTVKVIHDNKLFTLVPNAFFDENCLSDYLKYNTKILKTDFITYDYIPSNNSVSVYMPYVNINNYIFDKFGSFTYNHISTILIEQLLKNEKDSTSLKFFVNVNASNFEIIIIEKNKLLLYNSFSYSTKEDFIYYVLFTSQQLKLDPESFDLIFLGDIGTDSELFKIAYKYVRSVALGNREDRYKYNGDIPSINNHSNFALIKSF